MSIGLFYKWLGLTFVSSLIFNVLDSLFGVTTSITFFEAGFINFMVLWCAGQDKIKKGESQ